MRKISNPIKSDSNIKYQISNISWPQKLFAILEESGIARVVFFLVIFILFWARGVMILDPDFGWHLQVGRIVIAHGVPRADPFSFTMPSYPYVDHEWLTDTIQALLYPAIGLWGLAALFAGVGTLALLISDTIIEKKYRVLSFIPLLLITVTLLSFVGIRPQVISWLFFSILIWVLVNGYKRDLAIYSLPLLFILWANLHGGFVIGIGTLFVFILIDFWKRRTFNISFIIIFILSILATGITPYGFRIWWEIWMSLSDSSLRWSIGEWMPAFSETSWTLWVFLALSLFFVCRYWKKFSFFELVMYVFLLLSGLASIRNIPFWLLLALPLTILGLGYFYQDVTAVSGGTMRLKKAYLIFLVICIISVGLQLYQESAAPTESTYYPKNAAIFIRNHFPTGNIFAPYGWGGYIIWKLSGYKVFIDGRMPSWRWQAPNKNESNYAFQEYNNVLEGKIPLRKEVEKYNIALIMLPITHEDKSNTWLSKVRKNVKKILKMDTNSEDKFLEEMIASGFKEVYIDNMTMVWKR